MVTDDDLLCVALLFCANFGVGAMSFGSIFAAAGPVVASMAIYFISACNLHASVAVSKAMAVTPISVRTFSDLGFHAFGEIGRRVVLLSEAGVCFLSPIAFLVMGGTILLPCLLDGTALDVEGGRDPTQWIIFMAVGVMPVILIPTLKGVTWLAYIGGLVAVCADLICIGYSLERIDFSPRETQLQADHAVQTFGTIMFVMGTAILIPPIQRQHTDPTRLGNLVSLTLLFITCVYLLIGVVTYYQFGCTAPATLLDQLPVHSKWKKAASALMLVHVAIAFPVLLNPTLFDLERFVLGKDADHEVLQQTLALSAAKAAASGQSKPILSGRTTGIGVPSTLPAPSTVPKLEDDGFLYGSSSGTPYFQTTSPTASSVGNDSYMDGQAFPREVFTVGDRVCSVVIRTLTVALQTLLAIMLQASFTDIMSFIGATAIATSCMVMPCLCYLRVHPIATQTFRGQCDRAMCYVTIVSSLVLGSYCAVVALGNISRDMQHFHLFQTASASVATNATLGDAYPFCHEGERN